MSNVVTSVDPIREIITLRYVASLVPKPNMEAGWGLGMRPG